MREYTWVGLDVALRRTRNIFSVRAPVCFFSRNITGTSGVHHEFVQNGARVRTIYSTGLFDNGAHDDERDLRGQYIRESNPVAGGAKCRGGESFYK